jgi:glycerophosphoryl diester phosphodiesterase
MKSKATPIRPLLLGHRGARGEKSIAENTLASFDLAIASGCDGFEFDVRLSADGQPVICHDAKSRGQEIARSKAEALGLPLLAAVLTRYGRTAFLDIELKVPRLEAITLGLLRESGPLRGFVISSFLPEVLQKFHEMDSGIPLGLICETQAEFSHWRHLPLDYVIPHFKLLRHELIPEIKIAGKKLVVWTVNSPADIRRMSKWEVDGIISDNPGKLVHALGRKPHFSASV